MNSIFLYTYTAYRSFNRKKFDSFINLLYSRKFKFLGSGAFRRVWERKDIVVKIPENQDGVIDNMVEAMAWQKYKSNPMSNGVYLAPCRLLSNGCLMMVRVCQNFYYPLPDWSSKVDQHQVGKYRGKIVAYDYALDIPERNAWEKEFVLNGGSK